MPTCVQLSPNWSSIGRILLYNGPSEIWSEFKYLGSICVENSTSRSRFLRNSHFRTSNYRGSTVFIYLNKTNIFVSSNLQLLSHICCRERNRLLINSEFFAAFGRKMEKGSLSAGRKSKIGHQLAFATLDNLRAGLVRRQFALGEKKNSATQ